jgi:hypothetical protein
MRTGPPRCGSSSTPSPAGTATGTRRSSALITTIAGPRVAPAADLVQAYHQRHETGNAQLKAQLRGAARVLRSMSPDMVCREIYGYLLTHYAIGALDLPGRRRSRHRPRPGEVHPRRPDRPPPGHRPGGLPPGRHERILAAVKVSITAWRNLKPPRRHRTCPAWSSAPPRGQARPRVVKRVPAWSSAPPRGQARPRVVKRARHNHYQVKNETPGTWPPAATTPRPPPTAMTRGTCWPPRPTRRRRRIRPRR